MLANRIICALALVAAVLLFIVTNSAAALALVAFVIVVPLLSILFGSVATARTKIEFTLAPSCVAEQELAMEIIVTRPALYRSQIKLEFEFSNALTNAKMIVPVSLAPSSQKKEIYRLPVPTTSCGNITVALKSAKSIDSLGFASPSIQGKISSATYIVFPKLLDLNIETARTSHASFAGTAYDYHKKGQDRTEVFEIRDFREGDSLKSVHWKVSARFDDLVVREPSHPMDYDIALLNGVHTHIGNEAGMPAITNACMSIIASVSLALVRKGLGHAVFLGGSDETRSCYVDDMPSFNAMLDELMTVPLPSSDSPFVRLADEFTQTLRISKTVLVCDGINRPLLARTSQTTDLSVVHIARPGTAAGIENLSTCVMTHIPADDLARVKNLEL